MASTVLKIIKPNHALDKDIKKNEIMQTIMNETKKIAHLSKPTNADNYTTLNEYRTSISPTRTIVYFYSWQTHLLPIWSHGYQGDTTLLQSTNTR